MEVSVIVLNFNGEAFLPDCLDSLCAQHLDEVEVIVADNGSTDGSEDVVSRYPVRWHGLDRNHGFARGNNLAAQCASGDIIVFVNNDMRFEPDFLACLTRPFHHNETLFATDACQMSWTGSRQVHGATSLVEVSSRTPRSQSTLLPRYSIRQRTAAEPVPVLQACAANMAVRRTMFETLGGFDDRLPAGWEDTEICWRAWLRGWITLYVPDAICHHRVGATSQEGEGAEVRYRGSLGGRLLFSTKHLPWLDVILAWGLAFGGVPRDLLLGGPISGRRRLHVVREFLSHVPALIRERWGLYGDAGLSPRQHVDRLLSLPETAGPSE